MNWVLIVLSMAHYGHNQAAIPGFASEAQCVASGKVWIDKLREVGAARPNFVCIPGPEQRP